MKKAFFILFAFTLTVLILPSCDRVEQPLKEKTDQCGSNEAVVPIRKILLEDYTGHTCGNCPRAAEKVLELKTTYCAHIVPIAVHVGFFAYPGGSDYPDDYRTEGGNALDAFYGNGNAGLPNGLVNRKTFDAGQVLPFSAWAASIGLLLEQPARAILHIENKYNALTREVETVVTSKMLDDFSENLNITVYFVEDSIVGAQLDYAQNPTLIDNYVHRHMLRKAVNGAFGTALATAPEYASELVSKFTFKIDQQWNENHGQIVAFISNTETKEVIQAESKYILEEH